MKGLLSASGKVPISSILQPEELLQSNHIYVIVFRFTEEEQLAVKSVE